MNDETAVSEIGKTGRPNEQCPRFARCSVNHCLLDPEQDKRVEMPGDDRCKLRTTRRMRIAAQYPGLLPNRGRKPRELASLLAWRRRTPEEQQVMRERDR